MDTYPDKVARYCCFHQPLHARRRFDAAQKNCPDERAVGRNRLKIERVPVRPSYGNRTPGDSPDILPRHSTDGTDLALLLVPVGWGGMLQRGSNNRASRVTRATDPDADHVAQTRVNIGRKATSP